MAPTASEVSAASALLPALRTHTPTWNEFAEGGAHDHVLLVDHPVIWYHLAPSKSHHLYCCGAVPPEICAVNWTETPTGDGALRDEEIPVNFSGPLVDGAVVGVLPDIIANGIEPTAAAVSTVLPALRIHTPTIYALFAALGVHVHVLAVDQLRVTFQLAPSYTHHLYCCGAAPPVTVAVKVMADPVGCGALRSAVMLVRANGPAGAE